MFEVLFARPSTAEHYRSSPLIEERLAFLDHCEQLGIKPATLCKIAAHQMKLVRLLDLKDDQLNAHRIEAGFRRWFLPGRRRLQPEARRRFLSCSERWLRFLGWLDEPRVAGQGHASHVTAFAASMSGERGWSDTTIEACRRTVDRFFVGLDEAGLDLASVRIATIDDEVARYHARGYARTTIHLYAQQLRTFFRFAEQQGWCGPGLADGILPPRRHPGNTIPKGLNRNEVIRLLASTEGDRSCDIRARAIVMLYGAGLRTSEALRLSLRDVDLSEAVLTVRNTKFFKSRLVPLAPALTNVLEACARRRADRPLPEGMDSAFLANRDGTQARKHNVDHAFARLLEIAGIERRDDGRRAPCLHDLRHTAAVHRLTSWYRKGLDVQRLLPALSTCLGHANLDGTSVYLSMTPDLLHEASVRFDRYVNGGDHA